MTQNNENAAARQRARAKAAAAANPANPANPAGQPATAPAAEMPVKVSNGNGEVSILNHFLIRR
jgi:hypothetical protein